MLTVDRKYRVQVGSRWSYNLKIYSIFKLIVRDGLTEGMSAWKLKTASKSGLT